jgi:hypothetical protein
MIKHIVLLKIKPDIFNDRIEEMYKNLFQLKDSISNILSISGGKNDSPESKNKDFSESFVVEFENKEARNMYLNHQEHKKLAETYILPIIDDIIVFDYEY